MRLLLCFALVALAVAVQAKTQSFSTRAGAVVITPLYHASLLIQAAGKTIYVDPASPVDFAALPKADLIVLTHAHSDHFDPAVIALLRQPGTQIVAPSTVVEQLPAGSAHRMANGDRYVWQEWTIEAVPAYNLVHGPKAGQLFHPRGRDNGYVLSYGGQRFYVSGDSENTPEMRALANIDVAFVCMNLPFTMAPEEAAQAVLAFHPKIVIPYHFQQSNLQVLVDKLAGSGIEVRRLDWYSNQFTGPQSR